MDKAEGVLKARKLLGLALDVIDTPEGQSAAVLFVRFLKAGGIGLDDILDCPPAAGERTRPSEPRPQAKQPAREVDDEVAKRTRFPFGKHKGETLWEVAQDNRSYLEWAAENLTKMSPVFMAALEKVLELSDDGGDAGDGDINLD